MQRAEDVTRERQVDPLLIVVAQQVLLGVRAIPLPIDHNEAEADDADRDRRENQVAEDEALALFLEEGLVVAELVLARRRQLFPVDHVPVVLQV